MCKDLVFFNDSILMAKGLACFYPQTRNPQPRERTQKILNLRRTFQAPLNGCSNSAKWEGGCIQAPNFLKSQTISNKILLLPFLRMSKCQGHYLPLVLCFQTDLQVKSCFPSTLVNCPRYIQLLITTIYTSTLL